MDDAEKDSLVRIEAAKNAFKNDYVSEFVGLYLFLEALKKGKEEGVDLTEFRAWYKDMIHIKGRTVLKFSEKFDSLPVPKRYEKEIAQVDALVDKINVWIDEFYKEETNKNIDELLALIREVNKIIKLARKR